MKHLIGVAVVLACCVALSAAYTTSGNRVYDPSGNAILLRGIARPSLEWNPAGQYHSLADYQLMKNWGANVVRLSLNQCYWVSGLNGYTASYAGTVAQQVTWIKSLGMGVILDLHWSNQGNAGNGCGQQNMPDSYSTTFWQSVANAYKNDPWVIFELYNEPHDASWSAWRNGGDSGAGFTTPGFQSLYNTVRATGANNAVIISGLNYAYDLSGVPSYAISGTNIIYCTHPYAYSGKLAADWPTYIGVVLATYPVIATEFGNYDCSTSYYADWIAYANANNIGWTAWGWFVQGCSFPSLINDWNGTPSAPGQLIKTQLTSGPKVPSTSSGAAATSAKASTTTTGKATTTTTGKAATTTTKSPTTTTKAPTTTTTTGKASTTGGTSANTIVVYADSVQSPFADWSWASVRNAADGTRYSGSYSYSFQPSNWGAIYFYYAGGIKPAVHKSVDFYVNPGSGGQVVNFNLVQYSSSSGSTKLGPDQRVQTYANGGSLPANTWTKVSVPLSSFTAYSYYDGFWLIDQSGASQATMYVDSITVVGL